MPPAAPPPKITVTITTHRFDLLFRRALHSVKNQKIPPDEVIVAIDGLSWKLQNEAIVKEIPEDWKIVWTESENSGPAMPRNLAMYHASGDWILILDGDDFLVPSCIESYLKILPHINADVVAEFPAHSLSHCGIFVSKNMPPDRNAWNEVVRAGTKGLITAGWKRGDLPLRPMFIKNEGKKYYPIDFYCMEDKVLIFSYMLEERRIVVSDYCGYIRNVHPRCFSTDLMTWGIYQKDSARFKKIAANINFANWTLRDKIIEPWKSHLYLSDLDRAYIDESIKYFTTL
jgi:glycosyltransferase involved in cell wall biosynthesis